MICAICSKTLGAVRYALFLFTQSKGLKPRAKSKTLKCEICPECNAEHIEAAESNQFTLAIASANASAGKSTQESAAHA